MEVVWIAPHVSFETLWLNKNQHPSVPVRPNATSSLWVLQNTRVHLLLCDLYLYHALSQVSLVLQVPMLEEATKAGDQQGPVDVRERHIHNHTRMPTPPYNGNCCGLKPVTYAYVLCQSISLSSLHLPFME